jgi:hypothetical protein
MNSDDDLRFREFPLERNLIIQKYIPLNVHWQEIYGVPNDLTNHPPRVIFLCG